MTSSIGFMYTCFNEIEAVKFSIDSVKKHYPNSKIHLFSEGGDIWNFLIENFENIKISVEDDTMSKIISHVTDENFLDPFYQELIKKSTYATLNRVVKAIEYCESDYLIMMDPDAFIRGKLTIPKNVKLLGSRVNTHMPQKVKDVLASLEGAKVIDCWGATPGIFHCDTFIKAYKNALSKPETMNDLFNSFYAMFAHDFLIPIIFAMIGEEETFNPEIVECCRNLNWRNTTHPIVHQFKILYPKSQLS